jgi:hypothetical protein
MINLGPYDACNGGGTCGEAVGRVGLAEREPYKMEFRRGRLAAPDQERMMQGLILLIGVVWTAIAFAFVIGPVFVSNLRARKVGDEYEHEDEKDGW